MFVHVETGVEAVFEEQLGVVPADVEADGQLVLHLSGFELQLHPHVA